MVTMIRLKLTAALLCTLFIALNVLAQDLNSAGKNESNESIAETNDIEFGLDQRRKT